MGKLDKAKWCSIGCLIAVLALAASSVFMPAELINTVESVAKSNFAAELRALPVPEADGENELIEMVVEMVGVSRVDYQPVVVLKEKTGELYLPIWIGLLEVDAIRVVLEGVEVPRPLTPDLTCSIIDRIGADIDYIVISDLHNSTFYAKIIINADLGQMEIDARPSDAIAIALRARAPIYADPAVLDEAGIPSEDKAGKYTVMHIEEDRLKPRHYA